MKDYDFKGMINAIKEASPSHLALVSLIVFPVVLRFWVESVNMVFPDLTEDQRIYSILLILLIFILFILCIIWIVVENVRKNKLRLIRDMIMTRLVANNWNSMSFESAKKVLGKDFPDEKIHAAIQEFPRILRATSLMVIDHNGDHKKDRDGHKLYKAGVGRVDRIEKQADKMEEEQT